MNGFDIISKLGDGAYSVVYKVKRNADGKIYALKKVKLLNLSSKEKENALNEVRILASVKSAFVICYKESFIDEKDQSLCIVMEYADKGDLYQKITQFKKMGCLIEETDVWRIFIQMVRGLKALHELKILHRDLKSANIFLFSNGTAKLGDLNVSKVVRKGLGSTQTGTPYYASPEVWNDSPYDSKSDIWSLGCVTYEMLTLRPPFRAENMDGLYHKVIKGHYSKISEKYSQDIAEIIKMMLKVNPNDRPSCSQILKHPLVLKRIEFFQANANFENIDIDNMDEGELLKTIRIPKNILFLTDKLPGANYGDNITTSNQSSIKAKNNKNLSFPSGALPDIRIPTKRSVIIESSTKKIQEIEENNENKSNNGTIEVRKNDNVIHHTNHSKQNRNIKIVKEENGLPSLNKIDLNPIISPSNRNAKQKKPNGQVRELDRYINGIADRYKVYIPHLDYNYKNVRISNNHKLNNKKKQDERYYHLYMPKKNGYSVNYNYNRVIPNKKLIPLHMKVGVK